jgi:hypothetical protein
VNQTLQEEEPSAATNANRQGVCNGNPCITETHSGTGTTRTYEVLSVRGDKSSGIVEIQTRAVRDGQPSANWQMVNTCYGRATCSVTDNLGNVYSRADGFINTDRDGVARFVFTGISPEATMFTRFRMGECGPLSTPFQNLPIIWDLPPFCGGTCIAVVNQSNNTTVYEIVSVRGDKSSGIVEIEVKSTRDRQPISGWQMVNTCYGRATCSVTDNLGNVYNRADGFINTDRDGMARFVFTGISPEAAMFTRFRIGECGPLSTPFQNLPIVWDLPPACSGTCITVVNQSNNTTVYDIVSVKGNRRTGEVTIAMRVTVDRKPRENAQIVGRHFGSGAACSITDNLGNVYNRADESIATDRNGVANFVFTGVSRDAAMLTRFRVGERGQPAAAFENLPIVWE